jgi:16S rRNA (guanine527-N7)-methyltransferase
VARARDDSLDDFFKAFPALLGRPATASERNAFDRYADLLVLWNRTHHLTALRTRAAIGRGLFLDALLFRALLPPGAKRVVDIGAGAGIPGIPLRIVDHEISLTLVESRRKPVSFLHALIRDLQVTQIEIHHGRAEALTAEMPELAGKYDFVVTRAVRLDSHLIDLAMNYLRRGGALLTSGPPSGAPQPKVEWNGAFEWKTISFAEIGLTRRFFIASKGD